MLGLLASLLPSAISGVSGLAGSLLNQNSTSDIAAASRRAANQAATTYNNAGSTGAQAATTAAAIGDTASTDAAKQLSGAYTAAAGQGATGLNNAIGQTTTGTNQALSYLSPYLQGGTSSMSILNDALGINGPDAQAAYYRNFQNDPGFLASQRAGIAALDQGAASSGLLRSGGQMKSLYNYGQRNMESQFQDRLARLFGVSGQGLTAAGSSANIAENGSNTIADYLRQIGGVQGEGTLGGANALAGGILGSASAREGGVLGAANALTSGQIAAANARAGGAQNAGIINAYGQGQTNSGINDLLSKLSGPLSTYAQNYMQNPANPSSWTTQTYYG